MNRFPLLPGNTHRLVSNPEDFDTTESKFIEENCVIPVAKYNLMKIENGTLGACLKHLEDGLLVNFQKNRRMKRSLREITDKFHKLVEIRDDRMTLALRRLENGVLKLSETMDRIVDDFRETGMSADQFMEAMLLLGSIVDDLEPEHCLSRLFSETALEEVVDINKN